MQGRHDPWPVVGARSGSSCKAIHVVEFGAGQCISCREVRAKRFSSLEPSFRNWSGAVSSHRGRAARGPGLIRAPDSGDDAFLRGSPLPRTAGFMKGGWRSRSLTLSCAGSRLRLLSSSPRPRLHFSALICPHVTDSTHPPGPAYQSAFSTQVPLFTPDGRVSFSGGC